MASRHEVAAYTIVASVGVIVILSAFFTPNADIRGLIIGIGSSVIASVTVSVLLVVFVGNPFADLDQRLHQDIDVLRFADIAGLAALWTSRTDIPASLWLNKLAATKHEVVIVASAMQFLSEREDFVRLLGQKSREGVRISILLQSPSGECVKRRSIEEGDEGSIEGRIKTTVGRLRPNLTGEKSKILFFDQPLYFSMFRFDEFMFVTPHLFSIAGASAPSFLLRSGQGTLFEKYISQYQLLLAASAALEHINIDKALS